MPTRKSRSASAGIQGPYYTLGAYLKQQRISAGLSQSDVAKELGYTTAQFISNIERGIVRPADKTLPVWTQKIKADPNTVIRFLMGFYQVELEELLLPQRVRKSVRLKNRTIG